MHVKIFKIPHLSEDQESLSHSIVPHHMCGGLAEATGPPLGGCECGGVDDKLLTLWVIGCSCLQTAHKGAMPQLCLRVGPDQLQAKCLREPLCLLVGAGL